MLRIAWIEQLLCLQHLVIEIGHQDNVNELSNTGINRSVDAVDTGAPVIINNNNQVNDNSSNTNKTEYGSTTIGSLNPDNKVKEFANYS